jgi:hypothetical protein
MSLISLAVLPAPPETQALALYAGLPTLLGLAVYFWFAGKEPSERARGLRWVGLLPLMYGALDGLDRVGYARSYLYREYHDFSRLDEILTWAILAAPILAFLVIVSTEIWMAKRKRWNF